MSDSNAIKIYTNIQNHINSVSMFDRDEGLKVIVNLLINALLALVRVKINSVGLTGLLC